MTYSRLLKMAMPFITKPSLIFCILVCCGCESLSSPQLASSSKVNTVPSTLRFQGHATYRNLPTPESKNKSGHFSPPYKYQGMNFSVVPGTIIKPESQTLSIDIELRGQGSFKSHSSPGSTESPALICEQKSDEFYCKTSKALTTKTDDDGFFKFEAQLSQDWLFTPESQLTSINLNVELQPGLFECLPFAVSRYLYDCNIYQCTGINALVEKKCPPDCWQAPVFLSYHYLGCLSKDARILTQKQINDPKSLSESEIEIPIEFYDYFPGPDFIKWYHDAASGG